MITLYSVFVKMQACTYLIHLPMCCLITDAIQFVKVYRVTVSYFALYLMYEHAHNSKMWERSQTAGSIGKKLGTSMHIHLGMDMS